MNKSQKGTVVLLLATLLVVLLGIGALAMDMGHLFMVRNQLQNAADAAAMAGADYLYPVDAATGKPNWNLTKTKALAMAQMHKVDNTPIVNAEIQNGYWDINGVSGLQPITATPGATNLAAVVVTISKKAGQNGGPVKLFFGPALGISTMEVSAKATAVVGSPSTITQGKIFPIAISKILYDTYWNSTTNSPKINPSTGKAYVFNLATGSSNQGEWTTFNSNSNAASTVVDYIINGSPVTYKIGDSIWITTGAKTSVYDVVPSNVDVLVPVVSSVAASGSQTILAFGTIHINFAVGGSGKYVQVYFAPFSKVYDAPPVGTSYGIYTTPRLAN